MRTLIFLDDERNLKDVFWINYAPYKKVITVRTSSEFKQAVEKLAWSDSFELLNFEFSFDHDLADFNRNQEETGFSCAVWLINHLIEKNLDPNYLFWYVHSQNPIGKENIDNYLLSYVHFYNENGNPLLGN